MNFNNQMVQLQKQNFGCATDEAKEVAKMAIKVRQELGDERTAKEWIKLMDKSNDGPVAHRWNWAIGQALAFVLVNTEKYQIE